MYVGEIIQDNVDKNNVNGEETIERQVSEKSVKN